MGRWQWLVCNIEAILPHTQTKVCSTICPSPQARAGRRLLTLMGPTLAMAHALGSRNVRDKGKKCSEEDRAASPTPRTRLAPLCPPAPHTYWPAGSGAHDLAAIPPRRRGVSPSPPPPTPL